MLHAPNLVDIGSEADWQRGQFRFSGITSVDMSGSGLTNIGQRTFSKCSGLKTVVLPEKLERIGMAVFADCSEMTSMTPFLPATLRHIGWEAYIAEQKQADNFTAWKDAGNNTNTYLSTFADHWKPIGYVTVHKGTTYGNVGKWLVPHNFNAGTMLFVR